jgi:hypothetical protein
MLTNLSHPGAATDGPFSDMLMADRPAAPDPAGGRTEAVLAQALDAALAKVLPRDAASTAERGALAAAMAGVLAGQSVILRLKPDLAGSRLDAVRSFLDKVVRVTGTLNESRQEGAIARLAEVILPDDLAGARGALAADNLDLRDRFVAETAPLTSAQVGARSGHRSSNPYATAARWKKAGDVFSVHHRGAEYFPGFQFRDGRPHPAVKPVLAALPPSLSPWQRAFWFVTGNGWLDGATPADRLDDAAAVIEAARHEAEEVVG